jgi:hypothetical protein
LSCGHLHWRNRHQRQNYNFCTWQQVSLKLELLILNTQIIQTFTALLIRLFSWDVLLSLGDLLQMFQCSVLEFSILECGSRKPLQNMGLQLRPKARFTHQSFPRSSSLRWRKSPYHTHSHACGKPDVRITQLLEK